MRDAGRDADAPYVPRFYDEALLPDGRARPGYETLIAELGEADLRAVSACLQSSLDSMGATFGDGADARLFKLDAVPRLLGAAEWDGLAVGMRQRARALNAFLADVYGEQRIVGAGRVPAYVIETAAGYDPALRGIRAPGGHAPVVGFDLVRGADGRFSVLEENLRTPSGLAYSAAARAAVDDAVPVTPPPGRAQPGASFDVLGEAIRGAAPDGSGDPSAVVLSDGPENSAWWEHRELARSLGLPVVKPAQLHTRGTRLYAELGQGRPREVQVVYRRTDEDALHDARGERTWLADLLLEPYAAGNLGIVNAPGTGVGDDKLTHAYVDEMIRFYLGQEPLLPATRTYDLSITEARDDVLKRLEELVVKPRAAYGGEGVVIGRQARRDQVDELARAIRERPGELIAQETISLSSHPTVVEAALEPRHIDLRAFAIGSTAVPGALTRVALPKGSLVVNSSREGGAKDTWILT